jgi:hypothetical protein
MEVVLLILTADGLGRTLACAYVGQITAQAALVETQSVGLRVRRQTVQRRSERAQIDGHVLEGTGGDTARSITRWKIDNRIVVRRDSGAVVRSIVSVATDGSLTAIEKWRADDIVSVLAPVDIRLVSFVSALFA